MVPAGRRHLESYVDQYLLIVVELKCIPVRLEHCKLRIQDANQGTALDKEDSHLDSSLLLASNNLQKRVVRPRPCLRTLTGQPAGCIGPVEAGNLALTLFVSIGLTVVLIQRKAAVRAWINTYLGQSLRLVGAH